MDLTEPVQGSTELWHFRVSNFHAQRLRLKKAQNTLHSSHQTKQNDRLRRPLVDDLAAVGGDQRPRPPPANGKRPATSSIVRPYSIQRRARQPTTDNRQRNVKERDLRALLFGSSFGIFVVRKLGVSIPFNCRDLSDSVNEIIMESAKEESTHLSSEGKLGDAETKARVDAMWEKMNKGVSNKTLKVLSTKRSTAVNKNSKKSSNNWISYLGMASKKVEPQEKAISSEGSKVLQNSSTDDAKLLAATALSAVRDASATISGRGKVEITEIRDFAGQNVEIKKFVDPDSKEAYEKMKAPATSAVDAVLEQIKKKQKLSVLDKTKKDWGEFKEETKGLEEDLDAYKKSSNQYLDKVSFLQRADYREFERERDARLALQSRRRPDMREEP